MFHGFKLAAGETAGGRKSHICFDHVLVLKLQILQIVHGLHMHCCRGYGRTGPVRLSAAEL